MNETDSTNIETDFKPCVTRQPVLVTGGTGFIAGHIIQQLLLRGYRVRGTVRDMRRPETFAYLSRLQNAAENLELVEVNLR
jgi:dihydroflavonol-4-reductase